MRKQTWLACGAAVGLLLPFCIRVYERVLMIGHIRPIVVWAMWPTSLLMPHEVLSSTAYAVVSLLAVILNAVLFGVIFMALRRKAPIVCVVLALVVWMLSPPSDYALAWRFEKHKSELQQLVQMANHDARLTVIEPNTVRTVEGIEYKASEPQDVLSPSRWSEYRHLFKQAGVNSGLRKSTPPDQVFLAVHISSGVDTVGSSLGYLYCPDAGGHISSGFLPCAEENASGRIDGFRWKRLEERWYIYEVFRGTS